MKISSISLPAMAVAAVLLLPGTGAAQAERIDVSARGPQVGESIPEFTLMDQYGETWTQDSILGENGTMLVFIRSADW